MFFVGRGIDYAVGLEGSLKLKEISYVHSEAYAAGELKHGTISLIEQGILKHRNVFLENYSELKIEIAELDALVEELSAYMQSTGRKYADHAATLRSWSARKKRQQKPGTGIPNYTYSKEESL